MSHFPGAFMPASSSPSRRRVYLIAAAAGLLAAGAVGYFVWTRMATRLPQPGDAVYEEYVDAFEIGTAALDSGMLNERALEKLTQAIDKIPQEPAGWANRGICYLRMGGPGSLNNAANDLHQAKELAPDNGNIEEMLGHLAERQGNLSEAVTHFRKALQREPDNVQRLDRLYSLLAKEAAENADDERQVVLDRILQERPTSLFILGERASLAVHRKDMMTLRVTLNRLDTLSHEWHANTREALEKLRKDVAGNALSPDIISRLIPFRNLLVQEAGYSRDRREIAPEDTAVGTTFQTFLRLKPVRTTPSPADLGLTLVEAPLRLQGKVEKNMGAGDQVLFPVWLNGRENPVILQADVKGVRRAESYLAWRCHSLRGRRLCLPPSTACCRSI